jgi:hypothetical protein
VHPLSHETSAAVRPDRRARKRGARQGRVGHPVLLGCFSGIFRNAPTGRFVRRAGAREPERRQ